MEVEVITSDVSGERIPAGERAVVEVKVVDQEGRMVERHGVTIYDAKLDEIGQIFTGGRRLSVKGRRSKPVAER